MGLADIAHGILAGDLVLRVRPDTTGLDAELSAKLTAAERTAETSATRIGASSTRAAAAAEKVQIAQLRATAAEERYNAALLAEERNVGRIASTQASAIAARQRANRALTEQTALLERQQVVQRKGIGLVGTAGLVVATIGLEKLAQSYHEGVSAAERLETTQRQTETELEATGNAAGISADKVSKLAESSAHYSGIQDTVVQGAENVLLNFTAISDSAPDRIFDRATKAAVDLAVAYHNVHGGGFDVASQAKTLGLALNDPAQGLDRLRRAGIAFTAQQRDQIKAMAEAGKIGEAQARILDLVEQKVGGSAQAFGDTAEGQADKAKVAYEELSRTLAVALLPVVTRTERALASMAAFFGEHKGITDTALAIGGLTGALFLAIKAEQAIKALRTSELASIGSRLLGYRSLERAQVQLAAGEDRHAESAGRVAIAESAATRETAAAAAVSGTAAGEQAAAGAGAAGGRRSLLSRIFRRGESVAEGAGGGIAARAGAGLLSAAALPVGVLAITGLSTAEMVTGTNRDENAQQLVDDLLVAQRRLSPHRGTLNALSRITTAVTDVNNNRGSGGLFDFGGSNDSMNRARELLDELDRTYSRYLGHVGGSAAVLDREWSGHHALVAAYQQERDAIFEADLARANSLQKRADDAEKAYRQAQQFQHQVARGDVKAVTAVEQVIGQGPASLFDEITKSGSGSSGSSQYSIDSARAAAANANRSIQQDEAKIAQLRGSDTTTSLQLSSAESALARARTSAQLANERLANAEGKSADARKSSALSVDTILKRAASQVSNQRELAADAHKLVDEGITQPVLQQLYALDEKAPGTFANITEHITGAGVRQLNQDERLKDAARRSLEVAFASANTKSAHKAAAKSADLAARAWQRAYLAALKSPEFWQLVQTDLGRLLVGNQGVLPKYNAPGTGQSGRAPTLGDLRTQGLPGAANYNFNGPVTFTDPDAGKRAAHRAHEHRRRSLSTPHGNGVGPGGP